MRLNQVNELIGTEGLDFPEVTIKQVFDYYTGTGEYGPWSIQNLVLGDEAGTCLAVFKNRKQVTKEMVGRKIKLMSYFNDKTLKKYGVSVIEDKYEKQGQEVTQIKIQVTKAAGIAFLDREKEVLEDEQTVPETLKEGFKSGVMKVDKETEKRIAASEYTDENEVSETFLSDEDCIRIGERVWEIYQILKEKEARF